MDGGCKMKRKPKDLRRYTDLTSLFYLLSERKLTLRDPRNWDDANDRYYLGLYKSSKNFQSVLALCFLEASERYHFWQVFAPGRSGIRIRFKTSELLRAVGGQQGLRMERVKYRLLDDIESVPIDQFPFVKRYGFKDEREFRMIYESGARKVRSVDVAIPLSCIHSIKLNPWLHPDLFPYVKKAILSIKGCGLLNVVHSSLIDNETWKRAGDEAVEKFTSS
jgi:hypothetical protein